VNWPDIPQLWSILSVCEDRWRFTYPGVDIEREVLKMGEWLEANPRRKPRNYKRFAVNWLASAHGRLLEAQVRALAQREQDRVDSAVGRLR